MMRFWWMQSLTVHVSVAVVVGDLLPCMALPASLRSLRVSAGRFQLPAAEEFLGRVPESVLGLHAEPFTLILGVRR